MCRSERDQLKNIQNEDIARILRQSQDNVLLSRATKEKHEPVASESKTELIQKSITDAVAHGASTDVEWD
jgi:hypothetical protein